MCYHYSLTKKQEEVMRLIQAEWEMPFEPVHHANGFDFPLMPVITIEQPEKVQAYRWGLIPHWVKTEEQADQISSQTLNAKGETIFERPSFRYYVENRCVILADGFFEWMDFQKKKYPHYVSMRGSEVFGFAGLYAHWVNKETGELMRTFTLITTAANPFMERIHNIKKRMPVILPHSAWSKWLQRGLSKEQIQEMLSPCPDDLLEARTISKRITNRQMETNVPEVYDPFEYPELQLSK